MRTMLNRRVAGENAVDCLSLFQIHHVEGSSPWSSSFGTIAVVAASSPPPAVAALDLLGFEDPIW